jgi:hypothetical protein
MMIVSDFLFLNSKMTESGGNIYILERRSKQLYFINRQFRFLFSKKHDLLLLLLR